MNLDGFMARLKSCLIDKRHAQTYGVDYTNTFPFIAKITFARILISLLLLHTIGLCFN